MPNIHSFKITLVLLALFIFSHVAFFVSRTPLQGARAAEVGFVFVGEYILASLAAATATWVFARKEIAFLFIWNMVLITFTVNNIVGLFLSSGVFR